MKSGGGHHTCIDYLLASVEYDEFMQLAFDHARLRDGSWLDGLFGEEGAGALGGLEIGKPEPMGVARTRGLS